MTGRRAGTESPEKSTSSPKEPSPKRHQSGSRIRQHDRDGTEESCSPLAAPLEYLLASLQSATLSEPIGAALEEITYVLQPLARARESDRRRKLREWDCTLMLLSLLQRIAGRVRRSNLSTPLQLAGTEVATLRLLSKQLPVIVGVIPNEQLRPLRLIARAIIRQEGAAAHRLGDAGDEDDSSSGLEEDVGNGEIQFRYVPVPKTERDVIRRAYAASLEVSNRQWGGLRLLGRGGTREEKDAFWDATNDGVTPSRPGTSTPAPFSSKRQAQPSRPY